MPMQADNQVRVLTVLKQGRMTSRAIQQELPDLSAKAISNALYQAKKFGRVEFDGEFTLTDVGRVFIRERGNLPPAPPDCHVALTRFLTGAAT